MSAVVARVESARVRYGQTRVLHGVDLSVRAGEVVALIGETGSGKTTLARAILGLVPLESGDIHVDGHHVSGLKPRALRRLRREGIAQYVFQDPLRSLDPAMTVRASVAEGLIVRPRREVPVPARVAEALRLVGLDPELADRYPSALSGGQRQRVAVARAMAVDPRLLICDEPVSALDASSRIHVLELLREFADTQGVGILLITHDLGSVTGIADRVCVLYRGHVVETGDAAATLRDPQHPYTRLLVASAPTIDGPVFPAEERRELRRRVDELFLTT